MAARDVNQPTLAELSKVSQKTISNYINPQQRPPGANGKAPSAKLTEIDMIAEALDVETWELLRPLTPAQRKAYESIEEAFAALNPEIRKPPRPALASDNPRPKANGSHG